MRIKVVLERTLKSRFRPISSFLYFVIRKDNWGYYVFNNGRAMFLTWPRIQARQFYGELSGSIDFIARMATT
jgi:hypothetical protein